MGFDHSKVLAVLEKYDKLTSEERVRSVHHEQVNTYVLPAWQYSRPRQIERRDKQRRAEAEGERRQQIGMKLYIKFPDGDPRYVFPFFSMTFDIGDRHENALFKVCCDPVVIERVKEVLRKAGLNFNKSYGEVTTNLKYEGYVSHEAVLATMRAWFETLRSIIPNEESQYYFDKEIEKLVRAVCLFLYYNKVGFERLYSSIILPPLVEQSTNLTEEEVRHRQITLGMTTAIDSPKAGTIIRALLQTGISPDYSCTASNPSLLESVVGKKVTTHEEMVYWLSLLDLLLLYKANPATSHRIERSATRVLLDQYTRTSTPFQEEFTVRALARMAHAHLTGERILVHEAFARTRVGRAIQSVNQFYVNRNSVAPEVQKAEVLGSSIYFTMRPDQQLDTGQAKPCVIKVTTKELRSLSRQELQALYAIFAERFAELAAEKGVSLDEYFKETLQEALADATAEPMVDIVEIVGEREPCAFNMFQIKPVRIESKLSLMHRILLVAARVGGEEQKSISYYKGFMSMVQYLRGFILQRKFPGLDVYTVLEALNGRTPAQLSQLGVDYYPLYICIPPSVLRALETQIYEMYEVTIDGGALHVDDVLAESSERGSVYPDASQAQANLAAQRARITVADHARFFQRDKHATVIAFLNSPINLRRLQGSLQILVAQALLSKLIEGLAKIIQANGSYVPRANMSRL